MKHTLFPHLNRSRLFFQSLRNEDALISATATMSRSAGSNATPLNLCLLERRKGRCWEIKIDCALSRDVYQKSVLFEQLMVMTEKLD